MNAIYNSNQSRVFMYQINSDDALITVNTDWLLFAQENGADWITEKTVLGKPLWQFISEGEIRELYKSVLEYVRRTNENIILNYRGDSPDERRFVEMKIIPLLNDAIEFQVQNQRVEKRKRVRLLDRNTSRTNKKIDFCIWCNSVRTQKGWKEIDDIKEDTSNCPEINHVFCYRCKSDLERKLDEAETLDLKK